MKLWHGFLDEDEYNAEQQQLWKQAGGVDRHESTLAHQLAMSNSNATQHRGGLDFYTLARGSERSYSCSFLVNLDPDLLSLCSREDASALDLARDALISHTKRIFKFITLKSGREVNQFCFGSTFVQLNPNYRRFERMDPMTWKKEGIASHWTGVRGYRKSCCKICCNDRNCTGCNSCRKCVNGPTRGNYDGLVVLCAITRESLPNQPVIVSKRQNISKNEISDKQALPDHEMFTISLETLLSTHFMYGDVDFQTKCVPSARTSLLLGETQDELRRQKKFSGYVVYVAYRLEPKTALTHAMRLNKAQRASAATSEHSGAARDAIPEIEEQGLDAESSRTSFVQQHQGGGGNYDFDDEDLDFGGGGVAFDDDDFGLGTGGGRGALDQDEDEKLLEDLEDKQLLARIQELEAENSRLTEKVWKLEHGRTWVENRLTALETEVAALKGAPLDQVPGPEE